MLTETQLRQILPQLPLPKQQLFLPHLNEAMRAFEINTLLRTAAFVAQTAHESAEFTRMLESLYYTKAAGLMATWKKRFPTEASALPYLRNEQTLGNFVYADRMGNGNGASGDGFRYRGRGVIQLTGRDGYRRAGEALGLDLVGKPELVQTPEVAFQVAALYWKTNGLNELADVSSFTAITQKINGGQNGAAERLKYFEAAKRVLTDGFIADAPLTRGARAPSIHVLPANMKPLIRGWQDSPEPEVPLRAAKKVSAKKPAVKKAAQKEVPVKKVPAKKASAKRAAAKTAAKAPAAKRAAAKKAPAKKVTGKTLSSR